MPLSRILVICGSQFYWWRKPEDLEKTTDLSHVRSGIWATALNLTFFVQDITDSFMLKQSFTATLRKIFFFFILIFYL
jgi:hypothetical protein